jgi:HlyD family secretion protein
MKAIEMGAPRTRKRSRPSRRGPGRPIGGPAAGRVGPPRPDLMGRRALQTASRPVFGSRSSRRPWASWLLAVLAASGCAEEEKTAPSVSEPPVLQVVHPQLRVISRTVGQPSFVESYERTSIYPKLSAFIEKWNVDIGDKVRKGDVLADLFVPELREDYGTKKATVQYDRDRVRFAEKQVEVAAAEVQAAKAALEEARAILAKYESEVERWDVQVQRLTREVQRTVIDPQILLESTNQWKSNVAARDAAKAAIVRADAELLAADAKLARAQVDVAVARSALAVAESEEKRLEAWVGYLKLLAPYDGIIVGRNANTWDFVLPATGDPTAQFRSPHLSPSGQAAPIYVVDRTDIVRIFVDIPERDANYIHVGSEARIKVWAYRDEWLPAAVTRTSWALNPKSRTMRAEIDLPNPGSQILPGMYAYGEVVVERPGVLALPKSAITHAGGKSFIWRYEDGRAARSEVQTGVADGEWIEVTNRRVKSADEERENWVAIDPSEQVLTGSKLSTLTDGAPVRLAGSPPPTGGGDSAKTSSGATGAD